MLDYSEREEWQRTTTESFQNAQEPNRHQKYRISHRISKKASKHQRQSARYPKGSGT